MNDLISRQAVIDAIFSEPLYESGMKERGAGEVVPAIFEKIKALPSAQPEIIHCRECKWKQGAECVMFTVERKGEPMSDLIDRQAAIDAADDMVEPQESEG